jgi:hypothetical protein
MQIAHLSQTNRHAEARQKPTRSIPRCEQLVPLRGPHASLLLALGDVMGVGDGTYEEAIKLFEFF